MTATTDRTPVATPSPPRIARRRTRGLALLCGLVVFLNNAVWALVVPSFHVPDEPQHVAHAQYFAETGKLPRPIAGAVFSAEEGIAFANVTFNQVVGNPAGRPPWTREQDAALDAALAANPDRLPDGAGTSTLNNPPLYYMAVTVPYRLVEGGDFWTRLLAMRLTSALFMGLAAFFVFAFVRELLPHSPIAWTVGALAAGLTPVVAFMGGGVNNDAGLALTAAATLWALARVFRRGLDVRSGALVGACFGLGLVTKLTVIGFAPGLALAGAVLLARQWRAGRREAVVGLIAAFAAAALPVVAYVLGLIFIWDRPLLVGGIALSNVGGAAVATKASFREMLSYLWQFYLPRYPGLSYDPREYGLWDSWFEGWIGRFGWLDYEFPAWVYKTAAGIWIGLSAFIARGLWRGRAVLRRRCAELLSYVACTIGVLLVIGIQGYRYRVDTAGLIFEQARYLLPLLPLYGALLGLAVIGAGRRAAPAVGAAIVALTLVHGLGALVLTLGRYYA